MMRFSVAFLGLLSASAATAAKIDEDTTAAVMKLQGALQMEQGRHPKAFKENHFSRRLAGVEMKHKQIAKSQKLDSMIEAVTHLNAAQENQQDMMAVAEHLKGAFANINSFVNIENPGRRDLSGRDRVSAQQEEPEVVSGADFHLAMQCLAQAAVENDMRSFVSCGQTVKSALQTAIKKANEVMEEIPTDALAEKLGGLPALQNLDDPAAVISIITKGIASMLDNADVSAEQVVDIPDAQDFFQLIWMVPISVVWGSVLWMFIGLWTYGPQYGIIGSLWFEISWILGGLGCWMDNPLVCGIWNP